MDPKKDLFNYTLFAVHCIRAQRKENAKSKRFVQNNDELKLVTISLGKSDCSSSSSSNI